MSFDFPLKKQYYPSDNCLNLFLYYCRRSPKACVSVYMKFGADAPFQMIKVYKTAIENFIKARPREVSVVP